MLQSIPPNIQEGDVNLGTQLDAALPGASRALLQAVARAAEKRQAPLYLVGGFVRDLLLDRPALDFDLVVEGDAILLARDLAKHFGGAVTAYAQFGTATWTIRKVKERVAGKLAASESHTLDSGEMPDALDLVSARRERYAHSGALPEVERDDIRADTYRRDVTINTLALRLDGEHYGELIDHWNGLDDLRQGRLRVLHDASFIDDATRILRVLRFAARFSFSIEAHSLDLLQAARGHLQEISGERLRNEFDLILAESARGAILQQLQEFAILPAIHPALHFDTDAAQRLARLPSDQLPAGWQLEEADRLGLAYLLWLSDLVLEEAGSLAERLRFTRSLQTALEGLIKLRSHLADLAEASPSQVVDQLEKAPDLTLYALTLLEDDPRTRKQIEAYVMKWKYVQVGVNGNDLLQRGLPPGPRYAHILKRLRRAWLDGEVGSPDEEHALLDALLREDG